MYYDVILKSKTSFLDRLFTYEYDENLEIGTRVIVPFGNANSKNLGIIVAIHEGEIDFKAKKITEIIDVNPIISKEMVELAFYMIKNNISDYGSAINTILPPGSIDKVKEYYKANESLQSVDNDLYEFLDDYKSFEEIEEKFKTKYNIKTINNFVKEKLIDSYISLNKKSSIKYIEYIHLENPDYGNLIRKNALKQLAILDYLYENGTTEKSKLLHETNSATSTLNSLEEKELIKIEKKDIYRDVLDDVKELKKFELNEEQKRAYNLIVNTTEDRFLIHGVTGSGKTEVYLQLVEHYLNQGKEAIILVPEISLTPQTIERFQGRFGKNIAVLHSKLSISERADQWRMIKDKEVKIVVGARSAIFAPFENIGIIVIDEEHESSYQSDKNPKYSAIDIAKQRAKYHGAKLVLGSATPSMKTMYDVYLKKLNLIRINKRVNDIRMPNIVRVDMREELKKNNLTMFSDLLRENIENALKNKEQVILFLNKRGHTSFVFCRTCGYVHKCEACDVAMTYHKSKDRLICHYCGRTALKRKSCPNCGSKWIKEYGAGTEMLEEQTREIFPDAKVYRMDADTTTSKSDYQKVYNMMHEGKIDILIGTQMLSKGLDFPNVSVVGIVSADISLNVPDFRSHENTFNLITQVSGRAGRGNTKGEVIIQTYNPDNYAIKNAAENNYYEFFKTEMSERKKFNYPPIVNILNISISSKDRSYAIRIGRNITIAINEFIRNKNIDILEITGPTPSVIERINNRYRFDIIVKSTNKEDLIDLSNELRKIDKDHKIYINYKLEEE